MAAINVSASATALSENSPYSVVDLTFSYGDTTTQNGTVLYYGATLSDGTSTEDVLFSLAVTSGTDIPNTASFAYTPVETFAGTITATDGQIYYTA